MLETVEYVDEPPVTYRRPIDRVLLEAMKYGLGLTIREVYPMLIKMLTENLDPIEADGSEFKFGYGLGVPEPNAKVNYHEASEACGRQIVCRQSISDSWLGNLRECLAHLV
jgi:hypothetical protein